MTTSPLKKFVLAPVVLSAAVFSVLTLPLAVFGSQPVTIQLQEEPVFSGQLRDVATPYLGLASALSLGTGIASVAVTGWRQSSRKSSQVEAELEGLAKHLKEKEELLEALKHSESRLEASGLSAFLDEEVTLQQESKTAASTEAFKVVEPSVMTTKSVETSPVAKPTKTVHEALAKFPSVQTVLGHTRTKAVAQASNPAIATAPEEVEELHIQLQKIMAQMASLQTALAATPRAANSQEPGSEKTKVGMSANVASQQAVQSWSVH